MAMITRVVALQVNGETVRLDLDVRATLFDGSQIALKDARAEVAREIDRREEEPRHAEAGHKMRVYDDRR